MFDAKKQFIPILRNHPIYCGFMLLKISLGKIIVYERNYLTPYLK